ncbi:MAG: hypothetical protein EOP56_15845 [Sphingobacteriales bacterium]|nr:MAG: hypothetical protein EOP56_15845 [Sphingobacteriales bacterium]
MKKFLVIPVMFIYLLAVSGIMIQLHYCGQELESWNMYLENESCDDGACGDESEESDGCCENKVITAKVSYDQHSENFIKLKLSSQEWLSVAIPGIAQQQQIKLISERTAAAHQANAPPGLWQDIPLYKLHSSFTYYG